MLTLDWVREGLHLEQISVCLNFKVTNHIKFVILCVFELFLGGGMVVDKCMQKILRLNLILKYIIIFIFIFCHF